MEPLTDMGYASVIPGRRIREGELGLEKLCTKCDDWWPADSEFFWTSNGRLHYCCKACYYDMDKRKGRGIAARCSDTSGARPLCALPWPPAESIGASIGS